LADSQVDQIAGADDLHGIERPFGSQQQRTHAGTGHQQNGQQSQLQAEDGGAALAHAIRQAMAHGQHGARARGDRNDPAGHKVGDPSMPIHAKHLKNTQQAGILKLRRRSGAAAWQSQGRR
jgi:hypothetical protein